MLLDWDIVTPHYPPQEGGIADYTFAVAKGLRMEGDSVSVWCPQSLGDTPEAPGVSVHHVFQKFDRAELNRLDQVWAATFKAQRRVLLMYHPHGFLWHSLNVPFCLWLWKRAALHGDRVVLVLHEFGIAFKPWKYYLFATGHRLMMILALRGAARVCSPVGVWVNSARIWALGRGVPIEWVPVFSTIPLAGEAARFVRSRNDMARDEEVLIGHFGTCPRNVTCILDTVLPALLRLGANRSVLLIGSGTDQYARKLEEAHPDLRGRIRGLGKTPATSVSLHLRACDVMLQPYSEGVNARRSSAMAALANGVPMVTTLGPLTEPFWRDLAAIRLAPAGDFAGIITATEEVLGEANTRSSMSIEARSYYERHFTPEHVVRRLRSGELEFQSNV